jgi:hypothetical protein
MVNAPGGGVASSPKIDYLLALQTSDMPHLDQSDRMRAFETRSLMMMRTGLSGLPALTAIR